MNRIKQMGKFTSVVCEMPEYGYSHLVKLYAAMFLNPNDFEPGDIPTLEEFVGIMSLFGAECAESMSAKCTHFQCKKS